MLKRRYIMIAVVGCFLVDGLAVLIVLMLEVRGMSLFVGTIFTLADIAEAYVCGESNGGFGDAGDDGSDSG